MAKQVFNAFWHGRPLPALHWACLGSFVAHGHRLRLHCYEPLGVPAGVERVDARDVIPAEAVFEFGGSYSAFSNLFRYELLLRHGGWWVDTDVVCLRDELPDVACAWAAEDAEFVNGAILRFPAGDATLRTIRDAARSIGQGVSEQGQLGPRLLTQHLARRTDHFGTTREFYPLHWLEAHRLWLPGDAAWVRDKCEPAVFLHLWGMMFRYLGIDLGLAPPAGSFLATLLSQSDPPGRLAPLDRETRRRILGAIAAFAAHEPNRTRARAQLGYDLYAALDLAEVG